MGRPHARRQEPVAQRALPHRDIMPELPWCQSGPDGVFTTQQAREAGLNRHRLQALLRSDSLIPLRRGVYVSRAAYGAMSRTERCRVQTVAAGLAWHGSVISHRSALVVHQLPVWGHFLIARSSVLRKRRTGKAPAVAAP